MTALCALVLLGVLSGHLLLIPPMAASMALVAGAPSLPLAQPRSVVVGQVASALVGLGFGALGHSLWIAALAGGLALGVMLVLRASHSPAAATAVIGALAAEGRTSFLLCVTVAAGVLVLVGVVRARLAGPRYPTYWW